MAKNPIIMELPLNGSLAGRDRDGVFTATGSGALRYQPAEGARVNHAINTRFATNTAGWIPNGVNTVISRVADARFTGGAACRVQTLLSGESLNQSGPSVPNNIPDFAITHITVSFDAIWESGPDWIRVFCPCRDAAGSYVGPGGIVDVTLNSSTVTRHSVSIALNTTNFYGSSKFSVSFISQAGGAQSFLISNIVVEYGSVPSATYFDGSSAGASWFDPRTGQLGTAHASPSCTQLTAWVEEGTTNLLLNPGAENAVIGTGVGTWLATVVTKDTTSAYMGTSSAKAVTSGSTIREGLSFSSATALGGTTARTFTGSIYVRGSGVMDIWVRATYTDVSNTESTISVVTLSNNWTRITPTSVTTTGGKTLDYLQIFVRTSSTVAAQVVTFFADCAQIEEKAYATSYCDGSLGTGYAWVGTAHASASTRTVTSVYRTKADVIASGFSSISGSWIVRVLVPSDEDKFTTIISESDGYGSSDWLGLSYTAGEVLRQRSKVQANAEVSVSSLGTVVYGSAYIAYGGWSDSVFVAFDSEPAVSALRVDTATNDVGVITFGGAGVEIINGYLGPVAIYDRPLTDAELAKIDAAIDAWSPLWRLLGSNRYNQFQLRPIGA